MFGLSATEIIVILLVALLVFGPQQLPKLAQRLGKSLRELRQATQEIKEGFEGDLMRDEPRAESGATTSAASPASPAAASAASAASAAVTAEAPIAAAVVTAAETMADRPPTAVEPPPPSQASVAPEARVAPCAPFSSNAHAQQQAEEEKEGDAALGRGAPRAAHRPDAGI